MASLKAEIEAANVKFMQAFNSHDMTTLSKLYTADCKLMPSGMDVQEGRDGIALVFGGAIKAGADSVKLEIDEVGPMGSSDTIYERSHYTFLKKDGSQFDKGKYVVIWKKMDGEWYLYIDIFNSSVPPSQ